MHLVGGAGDSLVAGGYDGAGGYLASTELLVEGDSVWQEAGELPTARYGARAVTVNSRVILTGGCCHCVEVVFVIFTQEASPPSPGNTTPPSTGLTPPPWPGWRWAP